MARVYLVALSPLAHPVFLEALGDQYSSPRLNPGSGNEVTFRTTHGQVPTPFHLGHLVDQVALEVPVVLVDLGLQASQVALVALEALVVPARPVVLAAQPCR